MPKKSFTLFSNLYENGSIVKECAINNATGVFLSKAIPLLTNLNLGCAEMSVLDNLSDNFTISAFLSSSTERDIMRLINSSSITVPDEYIEIIREKTDVEILVSGEAYIRIWGAGDSIELNEAYHIQKYLPSSLAIGDDGGGGALIYFCGNEGFGLHLCRFADLDIDEAIKIAASLTDLLTKNVGIEKLLS